MLDGLEVGIFVPYIIFIVQSLVFSAAVLMCFKSHIRLNNALILFWSAVAVKICFAMVWVFHQTGGIELSYLQFPDERTYLDFVIGDPIYNAYAILVYYLDQIGFDVPNLKYLNILLTSFALVRLYTLVEYVSNKRRYLMYLLFFGGVVFLHVTYYSIFILKEAMMFFLACKLFVQLITRAVHRKVLYIFTLITLLALFRKPLIMFYAIFLFDSDWRIRWGRVALMLPIAIAVLFLLKRYLVNYVSLGVYYNLGIGEERVKALPSLGVYFELVIYNIKITLSPFAQKDIINVFILLSEWAILLFLLTKRSVRFFFFKFWPIWIIPVAHFMFGILTYYNIRYNLAVSAFILFLAMFCASGVQTRLLGRYRYSVKNIRSRI
jgi:hypothetical protein